jgi:hypothetical protein
MVRSPPARTAAQALEGGRLVPPVFFAHAQRSSPRVLLSLTCIAAALSSRSPRFHLFARRSLSIYTAALSSSPFPSVSPLVSFPPSSAVLPPRGLSPLPSSLSLWASPQSSSPFPLSSLLLHSPPSSPRRDVRSSSLRNPRLSQHCLLRSLRAKRSRCDVPPSPATLHRTSEVALGGFLPQHC